MAAGSISAGCGCRRWSGEVGDVAGTPFPHGSPVLASGMRGCRGSEDGRAGRPIGLKHEVEESDRLGEESSARRSGEPERGLALQFNRFRNPYGAEKEGRINDVNTRGWKNSTSLCRRYGTPMYGFLNRSQPQSCVRVPFPNDLANQTRATPATLRASPGRPPHTAPPCTASPERAHREPRPLALQPLGVRRPRNRMPRSFAARPQSSHRDKPIGRHLPRLPAGKRL